LSSLGSPSGCSGREENRFMIIFTLFIPADWKHHIHGV
jgi:hypothetical protein